MMKTRSPGFALVTALLVLTVLVTLALGGAFLANMNLRIAENTRTQLIATSNAQEGLDVSFIAMARSYRNWLESEIAGSGTVGELTEGDLFDETVAQMPATGDYDLLELESFEPIVGDASRATAIVVVRGVGPRSAEHISRARVETVVSASSSGDPGQFSDGFVTDGQIEFNGTGAYDINFYAGSLVDVNGNSTIGAGFVAESLGSCKIGKTTCTTLLSEDAKDLPLFAWEPYAMYLLNDPTALLEAKDVDPTSVDLGPTSRLDSPVASADPLAALQSAVNLSAIDASESVAGPSASGVKCTEYVGSSTTFLSLDSSYDGATVCLEPNTSVTISGTATGVFVVGDMSTSVNLTANSSPEGGDPSKLGIAVIAGDVDLTDGGTKKDPNSLTGRNFIYSYNSVDFDKGVLAVNPSGGTPDSYARTIIASQGDIDMNGAGNANVVNAVFWTAGSWCINGRIGTFRGTVLSNVDDSNTGDGCNSGDEGIRGNGSIKDAGLPDFIDVNVPGGGTPEIDLGSVGIRVLAKTP